MVAFEAVELLGSVALPMGAQHILGVDHDQRRLRRKLRQHGFHALDFHIEGEWLRKRGKV